MKQITLSNRLQAVAALVPSGAKLIDVGTDHGLLPLSLLERGRITGAIASDVNPLPLERARAAARERGMEELVDFRLCDGLSGVAPEEFDCAVIAGMGGDTIAAILAACSWVGDGAHTFLLQPMSAADELRRGLYARGLHITAETLVEEGGTLYCVLAVCGREWRAHEPWEEYVSRPLAESGHVLFPRYLRMIIQRLERARAGALASKKPHDPARAEAFGRALEGLKRWKEMISNDGE